MTRSSISCLILFISINSFAKNFPPEVIMDEETKETIKTIEQIKIPPEGYRDFYFDETFANIANSQAEFPNFDLKKAQKLSPYLHGIGISVKQIKPETKYFFPEYQCRLHLFIEHRDDYWLPPGRHGSWFHYDHLENETSYIIGEERLPIAFIERPDFSMRSFYGNINTDDQNEPRLQGSLILDKYIKNAYENLDYISYEPLCVHLFEQLYKLSIWLEKRSGPDFQFERKFHEKKDFYIFKFPKKMMKDSCEYIRKATMFDRWSNSDLYYFKFDQLPREFVARLNEYVCDFK